ncbi:hypothetical protein [Polynucleobacter sp. MWH-UH25E]|uniref:hypothetical protein n=1 Tax=Polynucleobacter sp. MWH-UH25E TaxID=1855616 RepID=UPI001BFE3915|nr:hypothetical protein [Polynucleobacter sp. MWH-UH25E]QWD62361.1 hypothetical protein ICV39_01725 [Polynucleobacter sp. MWH-UH25E]
MARVLQTNKWLAFALLVLGFGFLFTAFYPGFMSSDSLQQYDQSHTLEFSDALPPIMSWAWSKLNRLRDGPEVLLFAHLSLLWSALWIYMKNSRGYRWSSLYLAVGFLPWIACIAGVLWKDVGMAFCLLIVMATLSGRHLTGKSLILTILLLLYAFMVRHNSIFAIAPIVFLLAYRLHPLASKINLIALSAAAIILLFFSSNLINTHILHAKPMHLQRYVMTDDLFAISLNSNKSLIPYLDDINEIKRCSSVNLMETTLVGRGFCLKYSYPNDYDLLYQKSKEAWIPAVRENFYEYLKFRISVFLYLLRSPNLRPYFFWQNGIESNSMGLIQKDNLATQMLKRYVFSVADILPFLFKPYWWLASSILLLVATFFLQGDRMALIQIRTLLLSSTLYILGYLPITTAADFRYVYWSALATSIAVINYLCSDLKLRNLNQMKK